ncbi:hypothetical protein [Lichenicoccus sp.]|uniref:hypothetical protein n=1 Tax=Lichenicoccus sp. TaxID=2781899 RepID=UPI003D14280F
MPGTAGYERAQGIQQADDDTCQSYGFALGTQGYAECRENQGNQRSERQQAALASLSQETRPAPAPVWVPNRPVNCSSQTFGTQTNTTCY